MKRIREVNLEERLPPQQYNEMDEVKVDTIKEMFGKIHKIYLTINLIWYFYNLIFNIESIKGLKIFKVTSSEIYVSSQDTNTIIIINRENFVESMFNLEEIDEPMNDVCRGIFNFTIYANYNRMQFINQV